MKKILVCGGGGFIGGHLARRLKADGHFVRVADIKEPEFAPTNADEFIQVDLRYHPESIMWGMDEVYQLAADMGGMGFIHAEEAEIVHNNALINLNVLHAAAKAGVKRYFFSSSVCVYPDMKPGAPELREQDVYPAHPNNEYGWEKLYAERCTLTYARYYPMKVRIARFENTYGPVGTWCGGREKAPAALCRKAAVAKLYGHKTFQVWGDGSAVRSYTYVDDLVDGIIRLMASDLEGPVNLGSSEYVTVKELANAVIAASGAGLGVEWVDGPIGVASRNFSKERAASIGALCKTPLSVGIQKTYDWIEEQVRERGVF